MENIENNELTPEELAQKKALIKKIVFITILLDILIIYFAVYFFIFEKEEIPPVINTQTGSIQNYKIAEVLDVSCNIDEDCETPMDYLIRSSCPYNSKCLEKKCNVVCPEF